MEPQNTNEPVVSEEEMKIPAADMNPMTAAEPEQSHLVAILGVLIVILVLILGGLYLWGSTLNDNSMMMDDSAARPTAAENDEPESNTADAQVQALETVSTSDDLNAIQADVDSTDLDQLDAELGTIDAELDAAAQ